MLPKRLRLKDASLFQKAFRSGKPFFFSGIVCKALSVGGKQTLVGFAVSKKTFSRAVDRNNVKRMLSEAVRYAYKDIPIGFHIVFSLKGPDIPDRKLVWRGVSGVIQKVSDFKIKNV